MSLLTALASSLGCGSKHSGAVHGAHHPLQVASTQPDLSKVLDAGAQPASLDATADRETEAAVPTAAITDASVPASPTEWAHRWLDAIRDRDLEALSALTGFPFHFDDTGAVVGCKSGSASSRGELCAAVSCLLDDDLLSGALNANPEPPHELKSAGSLPRWAKRWRKEASPSDKLVVAELGDNGITYFFAIAVSADGVRVVFRHAEFWPN
jgi:hypothetical protein